MSFEWVEIVKSVAWPVAMIIAVVVLRPGLKALLSQLASRLGKLDLGGVSIELVPVAGASSGGGSPDLLAYAGNIAPAGAASGESELQRLVARVSPGDYLVIRLGSGKEWLSSRLFLFAVILQRMKDLKFAVFTEESSGTRNRYVGSVAVDDLRRNFGERHPWLETAYTQAFAEQQAVLHGSPMSDANANQLVINFLDLIRTSICIRPSDIVDVRSIIITLQQNGPAAKLILSKAEAWALKAIVESRVGSQELSHLVSTLNRVILKECLAADINFQTLPMDEELKRAARTYPDTEICSYTNRILIDKFLSPYVRPLDVLAKVQNGILQETSPGRDWVRLHRAEGQDVKDVVWEHARWINGARVERWLSNSLITSSIADREMIGRSIGGQRDLVLASSGHAVGIVRDNGDFDRLIDRNKSLDRFAKQSAHSQESV
jgi:hypothetical protein